MFRINTVSVILTIAILILALLLLWKVPQLLIVGKATGGGTVSATISSENSISLTDDAVDLGTIITGQQNDSENRNDWFKVENNGSVRVDINMDIDAGELTAAGSEAKCLCTPGTNQSGQCVTTSYTSCETGGLDNDGQVLLIVCLKDDDSVDEVNASVQLIIDLMEAAGAKNLTATFGAITNQSVECTSS